ncbi:hypothetical protein D9Q98_008179 [Chlorella vulgaris]|uniref:Fatty acid hydroxylase domain-containing protein n=1 Tax=Chlorella vulgaris TaxID=3077 RepID=A0A9D4YT17_CHLVU|nr:hypothetical protein D9Q98_008179 [Chlorella vulgaris]
MRFLPASGRAPAGHTRAPADIAPRLRLHFGARSAQLLEQEGAAVASPENHQVVLGLMERQACTPPFSCKVGDVRAPPTPAAASNPQSTRSGGAVSLAAAQGKEQEVPCTLSHALTVFLTHPSSLLIIGALGGLLAWRAQYPLPTAVDAAVAACVAAGWCLQEWAVHALLLHSSFDWLGRRIHVGHHQRPYFHVSIDDPPIVLGFMAASLAAFWTGFGGGPLALTAAATYYACGLTYEFTHYIVHTRYLPTSRLGRRVRMHHLLHHTRSEAHWLAFTVPEVDQLFGTLPPDPAAIRMSDMARASLKAGRSGGL